MFCLPLEHHTYSEDDVEEGGIKIKQIFFFLMKMAIFLGRRSEKRQKNFKKIIFIPNHHFWVR
jgi:hypothetical protein